MATPAHPGEPLTVDALLPAEIARRCEDVGERKARLDVVSLSVLAGLAGAFVGLGATLFTLAGGMYLVRGSARLALLVTTETVERYLLLSLAFPGPRCRWCSWSSPG